MDSKRVERLKRLAFLENGDAPVSKLTGFPEEYGIIDRTDGTYNQRGRVEVLGESTDLDNLTTSINAALWNR